MLPTCEKVNLYLIVKTRSANFNAYAVNVMFMKVILPKSVYIKSQCNIFHIFALAFCVEIEKDH